MASYTGVRIARKHISWYTKGLAGSAAFRHAMNQLQTCAEQLAAVDEFFGELATGSQRLTYARNSRHDDERKRYGALRAQGDRRLFQ